MTAVLHLPGDFRDDLEKLRLATERFKSGAISAAEYRAFRVPRGVYEQRESDTYMLRARCPGGIVLPEQMRTLARVARRYSDGLLHVTTRQDVQVHRVLIDDVAAALAELFAAGLSTKGGGGNTVRNITGCCNAGVCVQEAFDVSPHLIALTEALLPDALSYQLPRKCKIAFSGCSDDCAGATVNDLGLVAKTRLGTRGFAVYLGGGLGADSRVGVLLEEFVPADQVHESELPALHGRLLELGLGVPQPTVLRNLVACTGASTCKLGICLSHGLARAVQRSLEDSGLDLTALGGLRIHISGCPNSCGRHPVADIGLFGAARRVSGTLAPHYVLQVGGQVGEGKARLAQGAQPVPAKNVPRLIVAFLRTFQASAKFPDYQAFLSAGGGRTASALAAKHQEIPPFAEAPECYFDWEAAAQFSLAGRGPGECGAGVFDLIEVDLAAAAEALQKQRYFDAVVLGARALLVTQGQQAPDDRQSLGLFNRYFVVERLVGPAAATLVARAQRALEAGEIPAFQPSPQEVADFVHAIQKLYESMDASLRFKPAETAAVAPASAAPSPVVPIAREVDFRGVVCPLNYVKTTLVLNQLKRGDVLAVVLDEPGKNNVPGSVEKDGHTVLGIEQHDDRWRLLIRKS